MPGDDIFDVAVIGAGSGGLTVAAGCAMWGLRTALIEEGPMGGDCLNTGCVPSKALISAAHRAHVGGGERLGVTFPAPHVDFAVVMAHVHQAIETIAPVDSQEHFEELGATVFRGRATLIDDRTIAVGDTQIKAKRIVIATGSRPRVPPISGLGDVAFLTNETLWSLTERPDHLAIIGGGAIGMEMAQSFKRLGSQVTLVEAFSPMPRDDADAVALVIDALTADGVRFHIGTGVASVSKAANGITLVLENGETISASHVLVSTGRAPNVENIGLEGAGVKIGKDGIIVDARRRTSNPRIFAVGDCREGPRFTHAANHDGSAIAMNIALGYPAKVDWRALQWVTYTDPEIGQVGLTEADARKQHGAAVEVTRQGFAHNDRAIAEGDTRGFIKMIRVKGKVVGATIVGKGAGELLLPWALAITGKASSFALGSAMIAYPTRSEISKAAAFAAHESFVFGAWPKRWARFVSSLRRV